MNEPITESFFDFLFGPGSSVSLTRNTPSDREVILSDAIAAMREFCNAVEAGTIHSRNTYARFKAILARYDAL